MLQKYKEKMKYEQFNTIFRSVSELLTCLVSLGVKGNVSCCSKSQREKRNSLSDITLPVIIAKGSNPTHFI